MRRLPAVGLPLVRPVLPGGLPLPAARIWLAIRIPGWRLAVRLPWRIPELRFAPSGRELRLPARLRAAPPAQRSRVLVLVTAGKLSRSGTGLAVWLLMAHDPLRGADAVSSHPREARQAAAAHD
jgi:hypothetical protein